MPGEDASSPGLLADWLARDTVVQTRHLCPAVQIRRPGSWGIWINCGRRPLVIQVPGRSGLDGHLGQPLVHSASLRRPWSPASWESAGRHGDCAQLTRTEVV
jgi:hypothetical protein